MTQLQAGVTDVTADGQRVLTYPLTPTREQLERLETVRVAHARVYNLLVREYLEHRRTGTLTAKGKMQQVLVQLQTQFPELAEVSPAGLAETLSRVLNQAAQLAKRFPDLASADAHLFTAEDRYPGWAYPAKSSDWKLHVEAGVVTAIWLADVGFIATAPGPALSEPPRQVKITRKNWAGA